MAADVSWDLCRSILGVLREGSLSRATRALDITQPTAGRHVAALESGLVVALFTRTQLGLVATEAALALRPHAEAMENLVASMARVASGQGTGVRGTVRVSASEVVGVEVLPPLLAGLRDRHPDLMVELVLSNDVQDLLHQEADIAIRMVRPNQERLVARSIGRIELGLHAHQGYLGRRGHAALAGRPGRARHSRF
jgi:DNA-binding transcriptional LysR family regulator